MAIVSQDLVASALAKNTHGVIALDESKRAGKTDGQCHLGII